MDVGPLGPLGSPTPPQQRSGSTVRFIPSTTREVPSPSSGKATQGLSPSEAVVIPENTRVITEALTTTYEGNPQSDFMGFLEKLNQDDLLPMETKRTVTKAMASFTAVQDLFTPEGSFDSSNNNQLTTMIQKSLEGIMALCELLEPIGGQNYAPIKDKAQRCLLGLKEPSKTSGMLDYVRQKMVRGKHYFYGDSSDQGLTAVSLFFGDIDDLIQGALSQTPVSPTPNPIKPHTTESVSHNQSDAHRLDESLSGISKNQNASQVLKEAKQLFQSKSVDADELDQMLKKINTVIDTKTVAEQTKNELRQCVQTYFENQETKPENVAKPISKVSQTTDGNKQLLKDLRLDYTQHKFVIFKDNVEQYHKKISERDVSIDQPEWKKTSLNGTNISTNCFLPYWDYNPEKFEGSPESEIDFLLKANCHFHDLNQIKTEKEGTTKKKTTKIKYSREAVPDLNVRFNYADDQLYQNVTLQKTAGDMTHRATFPNQGATCWVNAALTEVVHTDYLDSFLNAIDPTKLGTEEQKIFYKTFMTLINEARNVTENGPIQEPTIKDFIDAFQYCEHLCSFPGEGFRVRHKGDQAGTFFEKVHKLLDEGITPGEKKGEETDSQALERSIVENHFQEYKVEQCTVFRTMSGELKFQGSQLPTAQLEVSTFQAMGSVVAHQLLSSPSELKGDDDQLIDFGEGSVRCLHRIQLLANAPQKIALNIQRLNGAVPFEKEPIFFYQYDQKEQKLKKIVYKMNAAAIHTGGWHWVAESMAMDGQVHTHNDGTYKKGVSGNNVYSHLILEKVREEAVGGDMAAELIGTS